MNYMGVCVLNARLSKIANKLFSAIFISVYKHAVPVRPFTIAYGLAAAALAAAAVAIAVSVQIPSPLNPTTPSDRKLK